VLSVCPMSKFERQAGQIGDGILRRLAQVFSLLGICRRCRQKEDGRSKGHSEPQAIDSHDRTPYRKEAITARYRS